MEDENLGCFWVWIYLKWTQEEQRELKEKFCTKKERFKHGNCFASTLNPVCLLDVSYLFAKLYLTQIFSFVIFILISFSLLKCFWLHSCVFMSSLSFSLQNIIWYANFSPNLNIFILIMNLTFLFQRFSQTIFWANCKNYKNFQW